MRYYKNANYHLLNWFSFFKEYTSEPTDNIYVKNFDLTFPFKSVIVIKVLL